ncbi:MAG TPA: heavy metal translocating P-type ATPase [Clostridiales bacterium]|nr:heavy metal translocating P-type ATPase [Clostridiales bacterium]
MPDEGVEKAVYTLENLGCANCAAKMERKIKDLPGVAYASITFATKQLRLAADGQEELLPRLQEIVSSIESDVRVIPRKKTIGATKTAVFQVENLKRVEDAETIEAAVRGLLGVTWATLHFPTKQLRFTASSPARLQPQIEKICWETDPGITLTEKEQGLKREVKKKPFFAKEGNLDLLLLGVGVVLFLAALLISGKPLISLGLYIASYLVLGRNVLWTAVKNIFKGRVFDENFLMSIASLGAFAVGEYTEAVAVMMFFFVGEIFEERAVAKSRNQIMEAVDLRPETVNLLIAEEVTVIPAEDAVVGDIVLVRPGDRIPLDGVVVDGESRIDTSPVTGEPVPVKAVFGSEVVSGCINTSEQLKIRVEKVLSESMVTRILDSVERAAASKPKIDRFITRFARVYTPFVVILAVATAVVPSLFTGDWYHWIYTALTFLVISCPCALVLSVPLAYFAGIGFGSRNGILFKGGVALEALKDAKAVVMDKTGTVTKGNFEVTEIVPAEGSPADDLLAAAASAELSSTHPIGASIVAAAKAKSLSLKRPQTVREVAGRGLVATWEETEVLCGNRQFLEETGLSIPDLQRDFYGTEVLVAIDGKFAGRLLIADTLKSDAKEAVADIAALGLTTAMLTGDRQKAAAAIAAETGMDEVHAKLMPQDKLTILQQIRGNHGAVMFVGDGINDAPVLAGADVGAAMGSGADAAIEAADVVFMTSEMKAVPLALKIARKVGRVALQNVVFALAVKGLVMILGLLGFANMWLAIFADTGVAMICIINSVRILYSKRF